MASAFIVDVTRIASRLGRGALTGIDRVELAYIRHIPKTGVPTHALLRTKAGILLLSDDAFGMIETWVAGAPIPRARDMLARLTRRHDHRLGRIETALRRFATLRTPIVFAGAALRRRVPQGAVYLNVGHSNLSPRMMQALGAVPGLRRVVLVHDTIPLDHPAYTRGDQIEGFSAKMKCVSAFADLVIHTAHTTRQITDAHFAHMGRVPPGLVAPLGIKTAHADAKPPAGLPVSAPYFVAIGTIEPRKNHTLLLDVWEKLAADGPVPHLFIIGNRGWADPSLLARLDRGQTGVTVLSGLGDGAMMALLRDARALLFPSLVEGFGLPPLEAASLGTPVISTPLPVIVESLGDYPVYLEPDDLYSWIHTIKSMLATASPAKHKKIVTPPNWQDHFKIVLKGL